MAKEIERKFLVLRLPDHIGPGKRITQGYFEGENPATRVRIVRESVKGCSVSKETAYLTLKGPRVGATCDEYEYEIPVTDAKEMLEKWCLWTLEKTRYQVGPWEVDDFKGGHEGLVVAEIELPSEYAEFDRPDWLGPELKGLEWSNYSLARHGRPPNPLGYEAESPDMVSVWGVPNLSSIEPELPVATKVSK